MTKHDGAARDTSAGGGAARSAQSSISPWKGCPTSPRSFSTGVVRHRPPAMPNSPRRTTHTPFQDARREPHVPETDPPETDPPEAEKPVPPATADEALEMARTSFQPLCHDGTPAPLHVEEFDIGYLVHARFPPPSLVHSAAATWSSPRLTGHERTYPTSPRNPRSLSIAHAATPTHPRRGAIDGAAGRRAGGRAARTAAQGQPRRYLCPVLPGGRRRVPGSTASACPDHGALPQGLPAEGLVGRNATGAAEVVSQRCNALCTPVRQSGRSHRR